MDNDFLHDLFSAFGSIDIKRMFSGRGIYAQGVIFAIVTSDGVLYFKTDETTREAYEREKSTPLTFSKKTGQKTVTSYWRLPERLYDEPDELSAWTREAVRVARVFKGGKRPKAAKAKPGRAVKKAVIKTKAKPRKKRL